MVNDAHQGKRNVIAFIERFLGRALWITGITILFGHYIFLRTVNISPLSALADNSAFLLASILIGLLVSLITMITNRHG